MSAAAGGSHVTFGVYDHIALGITLENLGSYAEQAEAEIAVLERSGLPSAALVERIREHQLKFHFYYRVRAHEKAHWYTSISSGVMIARLFADGDMTEGVKASLDEVLSRRDDPIYLPLGRWAQRGDCPADLSDAVLAFNINKYAAAAIDGMLLPPHMFSPDDHMLSAYFPDLKALGHYWETPAYRVGLRPLVEGAGRAAEWIYDLREDSGVQARASQDIVSGPAMYAAAFKELTSAVSNRSLLEYLQTLVVLIDISLNPYIVDESWPLLWGAARGVDVLPGFRFQRLLDLARRYPRFEMSSKESVAEHFEAAASDQYGWKPASEVVAQLLRLLQRSPVLSRPGPFWNPVETIHKAMLTRSLDPLAYVPPVNADMINRGGTYPQILLTAGINKAPDLNTLYPYLSRDLDDTLLDDIVNLGQLRCPIASNSWFTMVVREQGLCSAKRRLLRRSGYQGGCRSISSESPDWRSLAGECELYGAVLQRFFKNGLNRLRFIPADA